MEQPKVDLISFSSQGEGDVLLEALNSLRYDVRSLRGPHWLTTGEQPQPPHARLLYLSNHEYSRDRLCSRLDKERKQLTLAVADRSQWAWDDGLLSRCHDLLVWPCPPDELEYRVKRIARHTDTFVSDVDRTRFSIEFARMNLVGDSPAFLESLALIRKISGCDAPTLIIGATGTGKELAARAVHYLGARKVHPFVPVNCGAIPDELFENELFGHDRGAYTDAKDDRAGLIGQAKGGTLFLDEVDSLSTKAQVVLLRFLQDQQYTPLGGKRVNQADVRILAATNADLESLVAEGDFRQDLFFRINVFVLPLPSLKNRAGDIPLLGDHYVNRYCALYRHPPRYLHGDALFAMEAYDWPGNVRELENVIHRSFLLSDGASVTIPFPLGAELHNHLISQPQLPEAGFASAKAQAIEQFERRYLNRLMRGAGGNVSLAARRAGKERRALGKLLKKHGIDGECFRASRVSRST